MHIPVMRTLATVPLVIFGIWTMAFVTRKVASQAAVPQQQTQQEPDKTKTSVLDTDDKAIILKPKDLDASVYAISHSSLDPTLWVLEEVGNTASDYACDKNPVLPAKKVGDYCTASFQVDIRDAVCYLDTKRLNTIRCVWPNNKEKK